MRHLTPSPGPEARGTPAYLNADRWLLHLFSSKSAQAGGVVRRSLRDVERFVGWDGFCAELDRRGYHAVVNAGQVVVFCNQEPIHILR